MSQLFSKIKVGSTKRTTIDLSHHQVTTSDFGYILPICVREMVPNDDFVVKPNVFCRLAPLAVPVYGRITARVHHFFVPNRILFPQFDSWITQDASNFATPPYYTKTTLNTLLNQDPQFNSSTTSGLDRGVYGRLLSNLGINPSIFLTASNQGGLDPATRINALPLLAYYRIWMDYFADTNIYDHPTLVTAFNTAIANGGDIGNTAMGSSFLLTRNCCYKKDFYTTAKLNPQEGNPSIVGVDVADVALNPGLDDNPTTNSIRYENGKVGLSNSTSPYPLSSLSTSKIGQFTIEALRAANALQRYKERNNFVGTKIINRILAHFGISPTPERLDMAEFIDGSSFPVQIGDVTSTAPNYSGQTLGLGYQAGKGVAAGNGSCRYHAKEHGIFMTVMSIVPDVGYYQALPYPWTRGTFGDPLEYYTPEFDNLGYQVVLNQEVFCRTPSDPAYTSYIPDGIFGYVPRYADYKFHNDVLAGDFVGDTSQGSTQGAAMDSWHLFRKFAFDASSPCALNANFVECSNKTADFDRIFQITNNQLDHFYFNIDVDVKATRPMTGFTEPSLDSTNEGDGNSINLPYGGTRL